MSAGILMFIIFSSLRLYRSDNFLLIHSSISDSSRATLAGPIFIERGNAPLSYKGSICERFSPVFAQPV